MRAGLGTSLIGLYRELDERGELSEDSLNTLLKGYGELTLVGEVVDWKLLSVSDPEDQKGIDRLLNYAETKIARIGNELGTSLMMNATKLGRIKKLFDNDLTQLLNIYIKTKLGLVRSKTALTWELLGITPEGQGEAGKLLNYLRSQQENEAIDQNALREFYNDLATLSGVELMTLRAEESPLPNLNSGEGRGATTPLSSRREAAAPVTQSERNQGLAARIPFMEILLTVAAVVVGVALIEAHLMLAGSVLLAVSVGAGAVFMLFSSNRAAETQATTTVVVSEAETWLEQSGNQLRTVSDHASLNSPASANRASSSLAGRVGRGAEEEGDDDLSLHH